MSTFKLVGALALVLAFSAIGVASASAAETLWPWLPGSAKETLTGKSGKFSWQTDPKGIFNCTKSLILLTFGGASSEIIEKTLGLVLMHVEGCKAEGIAGINSVGDAPEIILIHAEIHNCMIKPGDFGILIKPLELHLEIPLIKELTLLKGSFMARITALTGSKKHYELEIRQAGGLQAIEKCEGGVKENLECVRNGEAARECAWEVAEGLLLFDSTIDKDGEELMEK